MHAPRNTEAMDEFTARVEARTLTIAVVGLGYAGLPLAVSFAEAGFATVGVDVDLERCAALNHGFSHVPDVPSERVAAVVVANRFEAVAGIDDYPVADVVFVCVPTPFTGAPDLSYVQAAARTVAENLQPGMLVVLQSTSYPGTTTEVVQPLLEQNGLIAGVDFWLAFSPERVDPGNTTWDLHNTPKVVGGLTHGCTRRACAILGAGLGAPGLVYPVSSPAIAEMTKLLENTYRMVNIALVNELAMLAHEMDIDFEQVIAAAATKPFGFASFRPGVGPGGECIAVDPRILAWKAREGDLDVRLIDVADEVNRGMARHVVERIIEMLSRHGWGLADRRVLCLGVSYKAGVPDTRNSRALRVIELLEQTGAIVEYADPLVSTVEVRGQERKAVNVAIDADLERFDVVVILVRGTWRLEKFLARGVPIFDAAGTLVGVSAGSVDHL